MKAENASEGARAHLDLFPMGRIDMTAVSVIAANVQAILGLNTEVHPPQPEPDYAFQVRREQYEAGKIIRSLEEIEGGAYFKLAVVGVDIYTPILTFVFGESQLGGKAAVISLLRSQSKNRGKSYDRAVKIAVHEIGHLLGLTHCRTVDCLMAFSNNLEKMDELPSRFCQACEYEVGRRLRSLFSEKD
ncbi:MAG: matrixin family metalloprotease [Thermodesulfobacteriota bacterium]